VKLEALNEVRLRRFGSTVSFVDQKMAEDHTYAPYCMRCRGPQRMRRVSVTRAECPVCPAVHDTQNKSSTGQEPA
jgi:hypothetical protein